MDVNTAVTIAIFVVGQMTSLLWFLGSLRASAAVLNQRLDGVQREIEKIGITVDVLSKLDARFGVLEERQLAQGRRLDEFSIQFNRLIDPRFFREPGKS